LAREKLMSGDPARADQALKGTLSSPLGMCVVEARLPRPDRVVADTPMVLA
jgi:hypothetical protein